MKTYTQEEMLDTVMGVKGTPERDEFDAQVEDYIIGLAIRRARESQNMTQQQLGERVGVQRSRICSIERGANITLATLRRIFTALGLEVRLNIGDMPAIALA